MNALAIARGIAETHAGGVWVESELGVGTTFWFTLAAAGGAQESSYDPAFANEVESLVC